MGPGEDRRGLGRELDHGVGELLGQLLHGVWLEAAGVVPPVQRQLGSGYVGVEFEEVSRPGSGMALKNVRERLRLMHDVAAQFETRQEADVFRVQIVVPL